MTKYFSMMRMVFVGVCSLCIMMLFAACQGVTASANGLTVPGQVQAGNVQRDETPTAVITNNNNEGDNNTGESNNNEGNGVNEPGSIDFMGKVQSYGNGNLVVAMPNGQTLTAKVVNGQSDLSDLNGAQVNAGQQVKVEATANADGSFTATKLDLAQLDDSQDQNVVDYQGVTTGAVNNNTVSFKVGNKSYSYHIGSGADLGDFNNNAQSIGNNMAVKVKVLFNGNNGMVIGIDNANN